MITMLLVSCGDLVHGWFLHAACPNIPSDMVRTQGRTVRWLSERMEMRGDL